MLPDLHIHKRPVVYLLLVVLVGLINGIIYIRIMPPWQHYDEPQHFEYAWLLAQRGIQPKPGDYDMNMRRAVAKSMLDNGFFRLLDFRPDLKSSSQPAWIGDYPQFDNPPFYYSLIALLFRLIPDQGVETQLYTGRIVSLIFFLLSLVAAWGIAGELSSPGHPLRLLLPLTLALLPGYVDLMTAVNNDSAAVAMVCVFLWAGLRLVQGGFKIPVFLGMIITAGLCYWIKDTTYLIYPLILLIILFTFMRGALRRIAWIVVLVCMVGGIISVLEWGDAAGWYRSTSQQIPTRTVNSKAVVGRQVFQLDPKAQVTPDWVSPLFQPVPALTGASMPQRTYTLGGWMWASQPVRVHTPELSSVESHVSKEIELGTDPTFFAISLTVPGGKFQRVWVDLREVGDAASIYIIYYDGLVLAEGARPITQPPMYADNDASRGEWGGLPFQNLLRNASAENAGLRIRPWADDLGSFLFPDQVRPSLILTYLLDWNGAWWFYRATGLRLLRTFWGMFGWGHVPLLGQKPYHSFLFLTLLGVFGAAVWFGLRLRARRSRLPWESMAVLGCLLAGYWGLTLVRNPIYLSLEHVYLPVARNTFPAIIPTILLLSTGWLEILISAYRWFSRWLARILNPNQTRLQVLPVVTYIILFVGLDLYSILSILSYYRRL